MMNNYREVSSASSDVSAGFQFEFFCQHCEKSNWMSPFKPYRTGQLAGWLSRLSFLIGPSRTAQLGTNSLAAAGSRGALESARDEAVALARSRYVFCGSCRDWVCADCFNGREDSCTRCLEKSAIEARTSEQRQVEVDKHLSQSACPNCRSETQGGRFCPECGFDMASTHKGCPGCGAMMVRQARFCTDCGHGF